MRRQHRLDSRPVRCAYASQPTSRPHCQLSAVVRYGPIALCADCDARRSREPSAVTANDAKVTGRGFPGICGQSGPRQVVGATNRNPARSGTAQFLTLRVEKVLLSVLIGAE